MFTYWYRIADRYEVEIAALAVFTGSENQKRPDYFHKSFLGTGIHYRYNVYHVLDHTEQQLLAMNNPFALIVLAAQKVLLTGKIPEEELASHRLSIARALSTSKRYDNEQIRRFLYFLKAFIHIDNLEINANFDKQIELLTGNKSAMGIIETIKMLTMEEGIEKGIERGEEKKSYEVVSKLLMADKFSFSEIANFAGVSEEFVKKVQQDMNL